MIKKSLLLMPMLMVINGIHGHEPFDSIRRADINGLKKWIAQGIFKETLNEIDPKTGLSLFEAAFKTGKYDDMDIPEILQELFQQVAEEAKKKLKKSINEAADEGWTPLYWAALGNNFDIVKLLLENGAKDSINKADKVTNQSPLFWAVRNDNLEVVKLLLEYGAKDSINESDSNDLDPLSMAVRNNNLKMVKLLLANGAKVSINKVGHQSMTPLHWAVNRNNLEMVKLLLFFSAQVTDDIRYSSRDERIKKLLNNPTAIEQYLTKEELEEFDKIAGKSKPTLKNFEQGDIKINYDPNKYWFLMEEDV